MTKNEFVDRVAADSGLSKKDAGAAVDAVLRNRSKALSVQARRSTSPVSASSTSPSAARVRVATRARARR